MNDFLDFIIEFLEVICACALLFILILVAIGFCWFVGTVALEILAGTNIIFITIGCIVGVFLGIKIES